MFTSERGNTTAPPNPSFVPLAPQPRTPQSKNEIHCFLFVSATTELFIAEADETVVLMLSPSLHLLLRIFVFSTGSALWYSVRLFHPLPQKSAILPFSFDSFSYCRLTRPPHVDVSCSLLSVTRTGNFKAVYQRARAHAALCNEEEARRDFNMVERLDPKFKPFIQQELKKLCEGMRAVHARHNKTYWDTTQEKWGPGGGKAKGGEKKKKLSQEATEGKNELDKKIENSETEHKVSSAPASAETERVDDAETDPDVRAEQCIKEPESGERE